MERRGFLASIGIALAALAAGETPARRSALYSGGVIRSEETALFGERLTNFSTVPTNLYAGIAETNEEISARFVARFAAENAESPYGSGAWFFA